MFLIFQKFSNVYMYDIARDRWTQVASMKKKRYHHSCLTISTSPEGKVLVCGGSGTSCEIWTNGQRTNGPTVPPLSGSRMIKPSLNSQYAAFILGGWDYNKSNCGSACETNKIYGIKKDLTTVKMLGTLQQKRRYHVAVKTIC